MYKVIKLFTDLQDDGYVYNVGDKFPRDGAKVDEDRIAELAGSKNRQGSPLIAKVEEKKVAVSSEGLNLASPARQTKTVEQGTPPKEEEKVTETKTEKRGRKPKDN